MYGTNFHVYVFGRTYTKFAYLKYLVLAVEFNETLWLVVLYTGAYTFICSEVTVRKVVVSVRIT